jgi:hypothetical protein
MPSEFPRSPKVFKGALVAYQLPEPTPTVIVFQYNPEQLTRSLQARSASGGGRGEANRTDGPPEETISLGVEIDAVDQLEKKDPMAAAIGLHPTLAALEGLMYPAYPTVIANQVLANFGATGLLAEPAPLALFVWGPSRVLPVRVQSVSITEQAFDTLLNPIQARAELSLKVLTYRELEVTNPAYWVYMASFTQKEQMSQLNLGGSADTVRGILPF